MRRISLPTNKYCRRCGCRVYTSDIKGYKYLCKNCDENMYSFEVCKKGELN